MVNEKEAIKPNETKRNHILEIENLPKHDMRNNDKFAKRRQKVTLTTVTQKRTTEHTKNATV